MRIDIDQVADLMREVALTEILPRWRNLAQHEVKSKSHAGDLVTVADQAAEKVLAARLEALLPGSVAIGEESIAERPELIDQLASDRPVWVIDPIDGTKSFADGETEFDVMVALVQGGERIAGWIHAPVDNDHYLAERGSGAWRLAPAGSKRIAVPPVAAGSALTDLRVLLGWRASSKARRLVDQQGAPAFRDIRGLSCCGHDYARLLRGEAHAVMYLRARPWDHLPGLTLLAEAGFTSLRHDASPYPVTGTEGGLLTAPSPEHWRAMQLLLLPL